MTAPFEYALTPHVRRHGPLGYADYASYRPWLRDEFAFRCVYCLRREAWCGVFGAFALDHFLPVKHRPDLRTEYANLLYVCGPCNLRKGERSVPDPLAHALSNHLLVHADGRIEARSRECQQIVRVLQLDARDLVEYRALWIDVLRLAGSHDPILYRRILGFPHDLPDLRVLEPPDGNSRPEGIAHSYFCLRARGDLPTTY